MLFVSPKAGAVDLIIDRTNPEVIYATTWQVYRKAWKMWGGGLIVNYGNPKMVVKTWIDLTSNPGMPKGPIGKIGVTVSPADPNRVWAIIEANEGGVFRSDDGGWTWNKLIMKESLDKEHFTTLEFMLILGIETKCIVLIRDCIDHLMGKDF